MSDVQKFGEEFQRATKDGFDTSVRSFGEVSKGFQAIAATVVDYSKKAFEDSTRTFEQLAGAKSFEQAWEIQSQYAKKAFDAYVAQCLKGRRDVCRFGPHCLPACGASRCQDGQEGRLST